MCPIGVFVAPKSDELSAEGFFSLAFSRQVLPRATRVAFIVGTILAFINHGEKILAVSLSAQDLFKILLTYLVPYGVSIWSAVRTMEATVSKGT
jgi:hypothetical protein